MPTVARVCMLTRCVVHHDLRHQRPCHLARAHPPCRRIDRRQEVVIVCFGAALLHLKDANECIAQLSLVAVRVEDRLVNSLRWLQLLPARACARATADTQHGVGRADGLEAKRTLVRCTIRSAAHSKRQTPFKHAHLNVVWPTASLLNEKDRFAGYRYLSD
eukprot:6206061-Pleurochrysis_carterae.AAC.2